MKHRSGFDLLYSLRHGFACLCMMLAFMLIIKVTIQLYVPGSPMLDAFSLAKILWASDDFFLRLIVIFNFIIKPIFIYLLVILIFWLINNQKNT
ncbi:MAG: hypothetical protein JJT82_08925 [Legionellaceae bacterium]|nr:hypothetical protein [Legionellaceae bacterium]